MVDALSLIHPTDKWYIYNFHTPKYLEKWPTNEARSRVTLPSGLCLSTKI